MSLSLVTSPCLAILRALRYSKKLSTLTSCTSQAPFRRKQALTVKLRRPVDEKQGCVRTWSSPGCIKALRFTKWIPAAQKRSWSRRRGVGFLEVSSFHHRPTVHQLNVDLSLAFPMLTPHVIVAADNEPAIDLDSSEDEEDWGDVLISAQRKQEPDLTHGEWEDDNFPEPIGDDDYEPMRPEPVSGGEEEE